MKVKAAMSLTALFFLAACDQATYSSSGQSTVHPRTNSHFYGAEGSNLRRMSLDFTWKGTRNCSSTPPAFTVDRVPKNTKVLIFQLFNLSNPSELHGGTTVNYRGKTKGLRGPGHSYKGPCVKGGGSRNFKWVVVALDQYGESLGKGEETGRFPSE